MKVFVLLAVALASLSACSWFGSKRHAMPDPTQIIVTGAPTDSLVFIDGAQTGEATPSNNHSKVLNVAPGAHTVAIQMGGKFIYREEVELNAGEHRVVTVLSGATR